MWSPAQVIAVAAGLFLIVTGGLALARSGLGFSNIPATHASAAGLPYTCLSALVQLVVGVVITGGGLFPEAARGICAVFGIILFAFGLVVAIEPTPFANMWGYNTSSGVMMAIIGGVLLVAGAVSPIFTSQRRVVRQAQGEVNPADPASERWPSDPTRERWPSDPTRERWPSQ
jgi:hypothetical protein